MHFNRKSIERNQKVRLDLAEQKNHDYSSSVDVIRTTGINGIAVRLFDKASRLLSLVQKGNQQVKDENIRDTLNDLANYADFGVSLLDDSWGKEEKEIDMPNYIDTFDKEDECEEITNEDVNGGL
jgi:hypothetical protein